MSDSVKKGLENQETTKKRKPSKLTTIKSYNKLITDLTESGLLKEEEVKPLKELKEKVMNNFLKSM